MTMNEAIAKWYSHFIAFAKNTDTIVTDGWSRDDVVHDMLLMALRKYGDADVEEKELYDYLQKTVAMQLKLVNKKRNKREVALSDVHNYDNRNYYVPEYM